MTNAVDDILDRYKDRLREEPPKLPTERSTFGGDLEKEYEIWSEGYACTGESGGATLHGRAFGKSFKDAIARFAQTHPDFASQLNKSKTAYWGCTLYANEKEARKAFG